MTKYARDEFDRVPETPSRQGVHRAAAESRRRSLAPVLAVGVVALVIGLVAFLFLPKLGFNSAGNSSAVTAEQSATPAASPEPTASSPAAAVESPSAEATPAAEAPSENPAEVPSATASPEGDAAVDKTQPVAIYNATGTPGLASRVGVTVAADGWTLGPLGNWGGTRQTSSVIFYNGPEQKANAEALAALLNIATLVDSAEFNMPLVVVLGPGFQ